MLHGLVMVGAEDISFENVGVKFNSFREKLHFSFAERHFVVNNFVCFKSFVMKW